ncbi:MAG TPA: TetR/AcrR family transcriptional regulator [Terrimicrobiaceae bacterium]|nr:TetR/AcrR family transcriptional regulator [Terrimicrobiaceae bacterium]
MRVSRQKAEENRARVVRLAARRFRERGFQGVSVADVMREAGLTHGGFYKQFASKDALIAQACALGLGENLAAYQELTASRGRRAVRSIAEGMLSADHRDVPAEGCVMAALGPDVSRADPPTRREVTEGIKRILAALIEAVPGRSRKKRREQALAAYAMIVGAILLARAVDEKKLSQEILAAAQGSIVAGK